MNKTIQGQAGSPKDGWVILGPGGGGCVHLLTVSPHRPDTMVVSCDMTAGYITHDGGLSWREFNLKSRQYAYAFDPLDPDSIYVGTSGLFRSQDNGATWRLVFPDPAKVTGETRLGDEANHTYLSSDNWPGGTVQAVLVDPDRTEHLFIVVKNSRLQLYFSPDRGREWIKTAELEGGEIHRLAADPDSAAGERNLFAFTDRAVFSIINGCPPVRLPLPETVLAVRHASSGVNPVTGKTVFFISAAEANGACGIWRSTDRGASWQKAACGLETYSPLDPPVFSQVSACERDARRVYLVAEKFPELDEAGRRVERYGILKSSDEGAAWEWVVKMDDGADPLNRKGGWAERDYGAKWGDLQGEEQISPKGRFAWDVVSSPVDPDVCYTMDFSTIFKTRDAGRTWEQLVTHVYEDGSVSSRGIDVLGPYGVFFDPFDPQHIAFAMTDVGVFHSRNCGRTWQHALAGVPRLWINTCYWLVFDPQAPGRAWSAWAAMHDIPRLKMFRDEFFKRDRGGVCRTEDGLATWQPSSRGLPEHALCTHLVLDPASPVGRRTLYAAVFGRGVYKSADDGLTWELKNNGIDPANVFAWRLALLPDGTLYLVVVKNQLPGRAAAGAVYRSGDGADRWQKVSLPEGADFPNDLTFDPRDERLYLSCWPRSVDGRAVGGGAYASGNGGATWSGLFDPSTHVYTVTVDPRSPSTLYLATFHSAVYRSDDRGQAWKRLRGFNFQWAYRPVPDPHAPGMLYVTTFGSSVWYGPAAGAADAAEDMAA